MAENQRKVDSATEPAKVTGTQWKTFSRTQAASNVRERLAEMCSGYERCMYCEDGQASHIDHFRPKVHYPGACFAWENLLLACERCNSNFKRDVFPLGPGGRPLLIDPTVDDPTNHLRLSLTTGRYVGITARGTTSIDVFGLNREICINGRLDAWEVFQAMVHFYQASDVRHREFILRAIRNHPFQGVRATVAATREAGDRSGMIPITVGSLLDQYPEVLE
ncbi:HNH endonuclease [Tsukamurella sp. NPDC003166]|uniref:HNH endonuclease n=1 Tax=Tsukamurella sp. NPDC003166 TaxID=3154444 RepID=UPI00339E9AFF